MSQQIDHLRKRLRDNLNWEDAAILLADLLAEAKKDRERMWDAIHSLNEASRHARGERET